MQPVCFIVSETCGSPLWHQSVTTDPSRRRTTFVQCTPRPATCSYHWRLASHTGQCICSDIGQPNSNMSYPSLQNGHRFYKPNKHVVVVNCDIVLKHPCKPILIECILFNFPFLCLHCGHRVNRLRYVIKQSRR